MTAISVLILIVVVLLAIYLPSEKDIFNISRVSCRYVNWMPRYGATGVLHLTCQLASAPIDEEDHVECTLNNCPIVNEHMKGKQTKARSSKSGPLTEGKTKTTTKPVGKGLDVMPVSPPPRPKPRPSGIRRIKEGKGKPSSTNGGPVGPF